jgi:hypothetical protein
MIIRLIARNTTAPTFACASENPYCLSTQRESNNNNNTSSAATSTTPTSVLTHRNLVGVLIIAALLALGLALWLCFGKWSKPIRHFLRGESRRHNSDRDSATRFGIGDGLAAPVDRDGGTKQSKAPEPRAASVDGAEKVGMVDSSISSQSSLADREATEIDKDKDKEMRQAGLEPALPAKVR